MKTIAKFMVLSALLFGTEAQASHDGHSHSYAHEEASNVAQAPESIPQNVEIVETIFVKAKGLVCDFCVRALEKTIKKRPEVAGLSVNLTTKLVEIKLKKGSSMDDETVHKLVTEAGYNIESIERK